MVASLTLKDCCAMQVGIPVGRRDFDESGTVGVIQLKDVDSRGRLLGPLNFVKASRGIGEHKFLRDGDVLFKGRGTRMTSAFVEKAPENTIASAAYFILRPKTDILLPGFLAWYLNNTRLPVAQKSIAIPMLQLRDLREMQIDPPAIEFQRQILETHKLIEKARALSEQYYAKVDQLLKGAAFKAEPSKEESLRAGSA